MAFAQLRQQTQAVARLQRSLERGRLGHAYLFSGPRLAELEVLATALAAALNCENPPQRSAAGLGLDSCDRCRPCRQVAEGVYPDVVWVRPEMKSRATSIDQVRALLQTIHLKPTASAWKVGVVVAADRLTLAAANAFLKTLEEPPEDSILLQLSTEPERMLETVRSRCLRITLASAGEVTVDRDLEVWVREFVATALEGNRSLLSRYRLLSRLLDRLSALREQVEKETTASSPLARHTDVEPDLRDRWAEELKAAIEAEYRRRRIEVLVALQYWLRDLWLATLGAQELRWTYSDLAEKTRTIARRLTPASARRNLTVIEQTQQLLHTNVQEALALEVGLLKLEL